MLRRVIPVLLAAILAGPAACADPQSCVVGRYEGIGRDENGTRWTFTLVLHPDGADLAGTFHWVGSNGTGGDEEVRGHADCLEGTFSWTGVRVSNPAIARTHYAGTIENVGASLRGRWTDAPGVSVIPGTFRARRR